MTARNSTEKIVTSFGAALASVFVTATMHGDILELTWNDSQSWATSPFSADSSVAPFAQNIDQTHGVNGFAQWNDQFEGTGRTFALFTSMASPGLASVTEAQPGQVLNPSSFVGYGAGDGTQFDVSGSAFIGFRSVVGNVGWFKIDFTQAGPIVYSDGQFASMGESITVGGDIDLLIGDVNCDDAIDLLDVQPFVEVMMSNNFNFKADINQDGEVTLLDVCPLIDLIISNN